MTYVVFNTETGYSEESMRFYTRTLAEAWIAEHTDDDRGNYFDIRVEH